MIIIGLWIWLGSYTSLIIAGGSIKLFQLKFKYCMVRLCPKASKNLLRLWPGLRPFQLISRSIRFLECSTISASNAREFSLIWAPAKLNFLSWQFPSSICCRILSVLFGLILQLMILSSSNCLGNYLLRRLLIISTEPSSTVFLIITSDLKSSWAWTPKRSW